MLNQNTINDLLAEKSDLETRIEAINVLLDGRSSSKVKSRDQIDAEMLNNGFSTHYTPDPKDHRIKVPKGIVKGDYKQDRDKATKRWSRKFDYCQACGQDNVPHKSGGYCKNCYYANKPPKVMKQTELELDEINHYKYKCLECDSSIISEEADYTKVQCEDCHGPVVQL